MTQKVRYCNRENIAELLQFLQPVTPTDNDHQADWYNTEYGKNVIFSQEAHIKTLKMLLKDCNFHKDIQAVFEQVGYYPSWPPYIPDLSLPDNEIIKVNHDFWMEGIGVLLRNEYQEMLRKFIEKVNELK